MIFQESMQQLIEYRGGKLRVPGVECPTYYVHQEAWDDALDSGYINENCTVTAKFREEYLDMFDKVGCIK